METAERCLKMPSRISLKIDSPDRCGTCVFAHEVIIDGSSETALGVDFLTFDRQPNAANKKQERHAYF